MKKILPFLILSLMMIMPATTTFGAEKNDCNTLKSVFNVDVKQEDKICIVAIPRQDLNGSFMGLKVSPEMIGLSLEANFAKVGSTTVVTGEFALLERQVNPVIDALRKGHLEVSALHNHWIDQQPQVLYLHFQGTGDLESLAKTVKSAMDTTVQK
ncbi:DUF1259 domain-containing protein [Paenibacillus sp. FA6]|uniref:DUF1259 domain-containing protein n=1 Tax=Paenibacillus sp. FA6 TaxID=3413029 RepID=UPI003F65B4F0